MTLKKILDELPYLENGDIAVDAHFRHSLEEAVELYTTSRQEALGLIYRNKDLTQAASSDLRADYEEVAASCGYFSFSLLDFAIEMKAYLEILDDLKLQVEERPEGRTWAWLKVWHGDRKSTSSSEDEDPGIQSCSFT